MSFPATSHTLLSRMRKGDDDAWSIFYSRYTTRVLAFLRGLGLGEQDAEDLWQEGMLKLSERSLKAYEADKGRFFSWLMTLLRHMVSDRCAMEGAQKRGGQCITVSGNEPVSANDPEGATLFEALADETQMHFAQTRQTVVESLKAMLRDYPDESTKHLYLDGFLSEDDLADQDFATRHGLTLAQWRYLRNKVHAHLRKRWTMDL